MRFNSRPAFLRWSNAVVFALGATTLVASSAFAIYTGRLYVMASITGGSACYHYPGFFAFAEARNWANGADCNVGVPVDSGTSVQGNSSCSFYSSPENVFAIVGTLDTSNNARTDIAQSGTPAVWGSGSTYLNTNPASGCNVQVWAWGQ